MSFSNSAETSVLEQVFIGTALPWDANTDLWIALHTASPTDTGTAVSFEANYGGYARIALARATDFSVVGNLVSNANLEQFALCTSGSNTITYASIVTTASGAGTIISYAALSSSVVVSTGIQPQFAIGALNWTLD
jgi:hypothetical protein